MKQIESWHAPKYDGAAYTPAGDGIYRIAGDGGTVYVTSLSFLQEPELGEGPHAGEISQYPLEDLLDEFLCWVSDFYQDLNTEDSQVCVLEFAAPELEAVRRLRTVIGKHVCNQETDGCVRLIIE